MYRDRDIVAKCVIVKNVDCKEEEDVDQPSSYWNSVRFEEERRFILVELRAITRSSYKQELHKC